MPLKIDLVTVADQGGEGSTQTKNYFFPGRGGGGGMPPDPPSYGMSDVNPHLT